MATDAEVSQFLATVLKLDLIANMGMTDEEKAMARHIAEISVAEWKIYGLLFRRYGGAVAYDPDDQPNPKPIEALQHLFNEMQRTKVLEIFDHDLQILFHESLTAKPDPTVLPTTVDFETPSWEKLAESQKAREALNEKVLHFDVQKIPAPQS